MAQLSYEKLIQIQACLKLTTSQEKVAKAVWCNQSTISRLLKPYDWNYSLFDPKKVIDKKKKNRNEINNRIHTKIFPNTTLSKYIEECLWKDRSPEQMVWVWKKEHNWSLDDFVTVPTVYSYIYEHLPDKIETALRRRGKKYQKGSSSKTKIKNRVSIHKRPDIIDKRERIGDFEWDTVLGKDKMDRIVTSVDRRTRYLIADIILWNKEASLAISTSVSIFKSMKDLPKEKVLTFTFDNWLEFADHEYLKETIWVDVYFADPYSSWQRWTNENTNWLLRRYFPKWTDFKRIDPEYFKEVVKKINDRPRKCLWFKTPNEVYFWTSS